MEKLCRKHIERHTAHTIVSWPNPKQWVIVHTSDLMIIRQSIYIHSIITEETSKLKTHSSTYCIMDNWENMLNLTDTIDKIYLRGIYISSMSSDKFVQWWEWDGVMYKETNRICKPKRIWLFALIINCTLMMTSSNGNIFRTKASDAELWCFLWSASE